MSPLKPNNSATNDALEELAQLACLETAPKTDVTTNVLRSIRVQEPIVAQKPLVWLALGSAARAKRRLGQSRKGYARTANQKRSSTSATLDGPVLRCIKADFCDQILILQRFSSSTRFSHFCNARNPEIIRSVVNTL